MSDYDDYDYDDYHDYDYDDGQNYDDENYDDYEQYYHHDDDEEDYEPEDDYAGLFDHEHDYESDEEDTGASYKSKFKTEISSEKIKKIIEEVMAEKEITKQEIPAEEPFVITDDHKKSKRYFEVKGFAWFRCPTKHRYWPSAHAWCFIDLKEQKICYRYTQGCQKCDSDALPEFDEAAIGRMAEYAVKQYLIRTGRWEGGGSASTSTADVEGGPHDEERCGKCKRLGRSCWKN